MYTSARCRTLRHAVALASTFLILSCGGSAGPDTEVARDKSRPSPADDKGVVRTASAVATINPASIPADAHLKGMFSPVTSWPLISAHAVLMPDGRVLTYGTDGTGKQTGYFIYDIWNPAQGLGADSHMTLPNTTFTDVFCSSALVLPMGGGVVISGGDNWTGTGTTNTGNRNSNIVSYTANSMARGNDMNRARWYSTSVTLLNGETYVQGGTGGTDRPEIRGANGMYRLLTTADTSTLDFMYPRNFIAPDGRVFGYDSAGRMYYVNPSGTGTVTQVGQFASQYRGNDASAAMFRPGRILQFGGNSNQATVIDITSGAPVLTPTQSMSTQRRLVNATILPNGRVMASGGSEVWNQLVNVNNVVEIWNPETGTWTAGAVGVKSRLYHSMALLLPDGSVMVGGGGAPGPENNLNVEIYFPPYLFTSGGQLAARPAIAAAPTVIDIGRTFQLDLAAGSSAQRVVLVKGGAVTHSWNMEQRFVELAFTAQGSSLSVQAPTRAADAPPGFYMLFVLDANGVPSEARMLRVNVAANPNPAIVPTLQNPGAQSSYLGTPVSLQMNGSDPNGDALRFDATGLPAGLSIGAQSGLISGSPGSVGSHSVQVTATDGVNNASVQFSWTVIEAAPLAIVPAVTNPPVVMGTSIQFTIGTQNAVNPAYRWDFGDGTSSPWSTSPQVQHLYAAPGAYAVTVSVTDDRGIESRHTFVQAVHLPLTTLAASRSTSITSEARPNGGQRAWLVNADTNTVSAFDLVTRTRSAEIAVGTNPRAIAVAPNGLVWVSNKGSDSISVIDAGTLSVQRTLALPRGSQPHGLAIAPGSAIAYVVLEATGQLLKFDTGSFAQLGATSVGPNARHVAVSANGTRVFVSRFITPPLPGEHTATVSPRLGGVDSGGEVMMVDAASMAVVGKIVLAHSDKPDTEAQGRGIPNYLGAMSISPDGTQAWVPSKQDNILRGALRDGTGLNFQSTVRAISSRVLLSGVEDLGARIDHDNASVASAAVFDPRGVYLFVALETSREVAVLDAHRRVELFRIDVGRAPQGLALSADGRQLIVDNFMDRTLGIYDLAPLLENGRPGTLPLLAQLGAIGTERLAANVLTGKRLFYDARDPRLARDRYMSCASCHNDGGHDGRVWDLTGFGEGLRNTVALRGRAGTGAIASHGGLHWTNNFDEVQDFEGQIRALSGGTGLMSDASFNAGTRSQPLGDRKAGLSADLDALAAYVGSLATFDISPYRPGSATLSTSALAGRDLFRNLGCGSCHAGTKFSGSGDQTLLDVGTIKPSSGKRNYQTLTGLDVPTLRDVWATAPYLHDGSAATLADAVATHSGMSLSAAQMQQLTAYLRELGRDEIEAPMLNGSGTGLVGSYYNNTSLSGTAALVRQEAVDFNWKASSPGPGISANRFSVRWTGSFEAPATGTYRLQAVADDGVRVYVNGVLVINRWSDRNAADTSNAFNLLAGQRMPIIVEYYESTGQAQMHLRWLAAGTATYVAIPQHRLFSP